MADVKKAAAGAPALDVHGVVCWPVLVRAEALDDQYVIIPELQCDVDALFYETVQLDVAQCHEITTLVSGRHLTHQHFLWLLGSCLALRHVMPPAAVPILNAHKNADSMTAETRKKLFRAFMQYMFPLKTQFRAVEIGFAQFLCDYVTIDDQFRMRLASDQRMLRILQLCQHAVKNAYVSSTSAPASVAP